MQDYRLPKTVRNAVFEAADELGFNLAEFKWSEVKHGTSDFNTFLVHRITHLPTGYHFTFDAQRGGTGGIYLDTEWTPPDSEGRTSQSADHRHEQIWGCTRWLSTVKEEHDALDLWAAVAEESQLLGGEVVGEDADEKFTPAERDMLRLRLNEIKAYLLAHSEPTPEEVTHINVTFNYVAEASDRLSKRDWKVIYVGSILPLLFGLAINKEVIHGAMSLAAKYILPLLGQVSFPLP